MIRLFAIAAIAVATPALAKEAIPLSPLGLPFAPAAPQRLPAGHPLHRAIVLAGVEALPAKLGPARRDAFVTALSDTLSGLEMLATDPAQARFRLTPYWIALDSPFRISFSSHATARLRWRLTRIDNGQTIFDREIATLAESSGGSAPERWNAVKRIALMTNIASVATCLDQAAYAKAPTDCALTPSFSYEAPMPQMMMFLRR